MKNIYKTSKKTLAALFIFFFSFNSSAILSGIYNIGGVPSPSYFPTFATAIASLNAGGVAVGGVTFNVAPAVFNESPLVINMTVSPSGMTNPVVFQNSGATPTLNFSGTPGAYDGAFKLVGSDYITFSGLFINDLGTSYADFCDYGFYLVRTNPTDACQNITIRNCVIDLSRANYSITPGACGVFVAAVDAGNAACQPTSANGVFKNIFFYSNFVTDMVFGFRGAGSNVAGFYDENTQIGVSGTNTIQLGGAGTANNVSSVGGILCTNGSNSRFENNLIYTMPNNKKSVYGIRSLGAFAGTITAISNTLSLQGDSASTSGITGIYLSGAASLNEAITISNNLVTGCVLGFPGYNTATYLRCIYTSSDFGTLTITNNTITNNTNYSYDYSGPPIFGSCLNNLWIQQSAAGIQVDGGGNLSGNSQVLSGNIISGNSSRSWYSGILFRGNNANIVNNKIFSNSLFSTSGSSTKFNTGIFISTIFINTGTLTINVANNLIHSLTTDNSGPARVFGIRRHYEENGVVTISSNTIHTLTSALGDVAGIYHNGTESCLGTYTNAINTLVDRNWIYDLTTNGNASAAYGLYTKWQTPQGGTFNYEARNNFIANLNASASNLAVAVTGMYFGGNVTGRANFNSVKLETSSTGTNFGTAGMYVENNGTVTTLDARNNLIVNLSTPGVSGLTTAFRAAVSTSTYYLNTSNFNSLHAGTPSSSKLLYFDGVNALQTLAAYQATMSPRDANALSANPTFSTTDDLHTNDPIIAGMGTVIPGIASDIDVQSRNFPPAVGADEPNVIILPIEVTSFKADCNNGSATLNWSSEIETETDHYLLESSEDMENFKPVVKLKVKNVAAKNAEYNYTDEEKHKNPTYYRLSTVGKNGIGKNVGLTNTTCIAVESPEFSLFPNPAITGENIFVILPSIDGESYMYTMYDLHGYKVHCSTAISAGKQKLDLPNALHPGIYIVSFTSSNQNFQVKLIIQ
jgi:hypothetical protein